MRRIPIARISGLSIRSIPKVQGDVAYWFGSNPAVPEGCKASELLGAEGCATNGYNDFDKITFWKTPDRRVAAMGRTIV